MYYTSNAYISVFTGALAFKKTYLQRTNDGKASWTPQCASSIFSINVVYLSIINHFFRFLIIGVFFEKNFQIIGVILEELIFSFLFYVAIVCHPPTNQ